MQATTAQATAVAQASARAAARPAPAASAYQGYQILRRNGAVVSFEPNKIAVALMKAFLAVHGTQGAASASVRETVDGLTESVVRGLLRSRPGGGTFHIEDVQDQVELGLMRGGHHEVARAYVLYRERRAQERAKQGAGAGRRRAGADGHRPRRARAVRFGAHADADRVGVRRPRRRRAARADPGRDQAQPLRRRADRRSPQGGDPRRAHADREGPRLHAGDGAPPAAHDPARDPRRGAAPVGHAGALRRVLPAVRQEGRRRRAARREAPPLRPRPPRRRAQGRPRPAVRLPRPADPLRPLLPAHRRSAHRAAAGVLHARGDGPGAERDRPRGARDRVLRGALDVRLHELDADALQRRHAPLAAVELLPDDRLRRPRRHLRGAQGKRAALEVRRRPRQRLDQRARARQLHQGHQRQEPGRGAVPEGRQRHRGRRQPGRQEEGRGLRLPGKLAPRHRGVPRAAQEHRRRPPPHARHEHRQLGARPAHEAGDGRRRVDALLAEHLPRPARQVRPRLRGRLHRATKTRRRAARSSCSRR